jgi:putative membrane protein
MSQSAKLPKENPLIFLYRVLQGALIGGGAILPGVSGGVLAVVFGIYRPMMAFLSKPFATFRTHYKLFIPIILGVGLGFWGFAKLVVLLFSRSSPIPLALFVGLILGTVPLLYRAAQKPQDGVLLTAKEKKNNRLALLIGFIVLMGFLLLISGQSGQDLEPTLLWSLVSGLVWGFSLVVPGLSSSSILLFIGIYTKIMAGVENLDFSIIIPLFLGIAIVAFLFARFIDRLYERRYGIASNAVVGLVLASTLAIIIIPPPEYRLTGLVQGLICLTVAVVGFITAHYLAIWGEKIKPPEE